MIVETEDSLTATFQRTQGNHFSLEKVTREPIWYRLDFNQRTSRQRIAVDVDGRQGKPRRQFR